MECGEPDEALEILKDIYESNTGDSAANYPVGFYYIPPINYTNCEFHIFKILSLREKVRTLSVVSTYSTKSVRNLRIRKPKELKLLLLEIWTQTKALCKPPHVKYTIITCLIQFGLTSRYESKITSSIHHNHEFFSAIILL